MRGMLRGYVFFGLLLVGMGLWLAGCAMGDVRPSPTRTALPPAPPLAGRMTAVPLGATAVPTMVVLPTVTSSPTAVATLTIAPSPTATATPTVTPSPTPSYPLYDGPPLARGTLGLQVHLHGQDIGLILAQLEELDVGWVKTQVSWKLHQPEPDRYDEVLFAELDALVDGANALGVRVLVGVAKAPEWSRPTTEMDGPPSDYALFGAFMRVLAGRYNGRVAAYELWNETNLQREWNGAPLSGADLVELIRVGAQAVREVDGGALVLSGAPAPTGINDGVTAVDDRVYFEQMVAAGVGRWVDGLGVHPYGWANPPESSVQNPAVGIGSHNDHRSFFFADTLADYRAILQAAGWGEMRLWATEFGWGTFENIGEPVPGTEFMNGVSEWQQAQYGVAAFGVADGDALLGPFFLWNLNFAPLLGTDFSESGYSILRPDGSKRPLYWSLVYLPKRE